MKDQFEGYADHVEDTMYGMHNAGNAYGFVDPRQAYRQYTRQHRREMRRQRRQLPKDERRRVRQMTRKLVRYDKLTGIINKNQPKAVRREAKTNIAFDVMYPDYPIVVPNKEAFRAARQKKRSRKKKRK